MRFYSVLIFVFLILRGYIQGDSLNVIVIGAHPDDCDICASGTAMLWARMGHHVKFLSLTNGDAGHQDMGGGALARRRRTESHEVAKRLGIAEYEVLDNHDGELEPTLDVRLQVIRRIRQWNADIVILPRPNDYHPDHRNTGLVVQDAAYMVIVPNVASDTPPLKKNPVFLYCRDRFQKPNPFVPDIAVSIDEVFNLKMKGLDAHQSQFYEWLPWTENALDQVPKAANKRIQWLSKIWARPLTDEIKSALKAWYGESQGSEIQHAEVFEICEYGAQPSKSEIIDLFPMIRQNPAIISNKINEKIIIDGKLDETFYSEIQPISMDNSMSGKTVGDDAYKTHVWVYHDTKNLYLAYSCMDRDIHSTYTERDEHLWNQEVVEVFIDTDDDPNTYFEIEVSPANILFDSYITDPGKIDLIETPKFNFKHIQHAVQVEGSLNKRNDRDSRWTVEISIPFAELSEAGSRYDKNTTEWKINFYRINNDSSKLKYSAWSPTFGSFHNPYRFGKIRFEAE